MLGTSGIGGRWTASAKVWVAIFAAVVPLAWVASAPAAFPGPDASQQAQFGNQKAHKQAKRQSPEAKARRERSRTAFKRLSRAEAIRATREEAKGVLGAGRFSPLKLSGEQRVTKYLGRFGARVTDEHGATNKGIVIDSLLPLTSDIGDGDEHSVDLRLEEQAGKITAVNPITPVSVGGEAGDWMSIGKSGVRFRLKTSQPDRPLTTVDDRAFADNVGTDEDFVVAGDPRGLV